LSSKQKSPSNSRTRKREARRGTVDRKDGKRERAEGLANKRVKRGGKKKQICCIALEGRQAQQLEKGQDWKTGIQKRVRQHENG